MWEGNGLPLSERYLPRHTVAVRKLVTPGWQISICVQCMTLRFSCLRRELIVAQACVIVTVPE